MTRRTASGRARATPVPYPRASHGPSRRQPPLYRRSRKLSTPARSGRRWAALGSPTGLLLAGRPLDERRRRGRARVHGDVHAERHGQRRRGGDTSPVAAGASVSPAAVTTAACSRSTLSPRCTRSNPLQSRKRSIFLSLIEETEILTVICLIQGQHPGGDGDRCRVRQGHSLRASSSIASASTPNRLPNRRRSPVSSTAGRSRWASRPRAIMR